MMSLYTPPWQDTDDEPECCGNCENWDPYPDGERGICDADLEQHVSMTGRYTLDTDVEACCKNHQSIYPPEMDAETLDCVRYHEMKENGR